MFGRRSHARFNIDPASEGVLRVLRDVNVQHLDDDEVVVVARDPGVVGERLTIEIVSGDDSTSIAARVVESRPVVMDGAVRHRLRLNRIAAVAVL